MLRKVFLLTVLLSLTVCAACSAGAEEIVFEEIGVREARPTDAPILSGSLNPMIGESYQYTVVNAGKVSSLSVMIYPAEDAPSGGITYWPNEGIAITPDAEGTFRFTFAEVRPYKIEVSYVQNGVSGSFYEIVKSMDPSDTLGIKIAEVARLCRQSGAQSNYDIALWLHDYLTHHAYYDHSRTEYGPDGVLLKGYGVCDSYSRAYQMLLDEFGIPNHRQSGTSRGERHAWNVIMVNGKWYNVDVTWDDPGTDTVPVSGREHHEYFAIPDSMLGTDHDYDITYPCNDTDASYYAVNGLPPHAADSAVSDVQESGQIGSDTITVPAGEYWYYVILNENGSVKTCYSSDLQNEVVFPLIAGQLSARWWQESQGSLTVLRYDFVYDSQNRQLVGTRKESSSVSISLAWESWPVYADRMAVHYTLDKPCNDLSLRFRYGPEYGSYWTGSRHLTGLEGTITFSYTEGSPCRVALMSGNQETEALWAAPAQDNGNLFHLPEQTKTIDSEALAETAGRLVRIPDGCTAIASRAFAGMDLLEVVIPASVVSIAADAFENCPSTLWLVVEENSYADSWADGRFRHRTIGGKLLD